jgi:hypothetical protein
VIVVVMTVCALIVAILDWDNSPYSKTAIVLCAIVAGLGLTAIIYQMRRLYRHDIVRELISELLADGTEVTLSVDDKTIQGQTAIRKWCERAESVLRQYLGESYVRRFHLGGSNTQDATRMTVWKTNHRLETLASFLTELK